MVTIVETVMMMRFQSGCLLVDLLSVRVVSKAFIPIFRIGTCPDRVEVKHDRESEKNALTQIKSGPPQLTREEPSK
jgi:hypothetical protein